MNKPFKLLIIGVTGLVIVLFVAIGVFVQTFDASDYKADLVELVERHTGRDFSIDGEIRLATSLFPTLVVEDATLGNADWASKPVMFSAARTEVQIALLPLLKSDIVLRRIRLQEPVVNLEIGPEGMGNWKFEDTTKQETSAEKGRSLEIDINKLMIEQAAISYHGTTEAEPLKFTIERLNIRPDNFSSELQIDLEANWGDLPVRMEGTMGSLAQLRSDAAYPLSLSTSVGAASGELQGRIGHPAEVADIQASFSLSSDSLADFNNFADLDWPDNGPLRIQAEIRGQPSELHFDALKVRLAGSDLYGKATWHMTDKRPRLSADLQSDRLDLVPYQPEEPEESEKLFSSKKLNLAGLSAIDADISLNVDKLRSRTVNLDSLTLQATLKDGLLTLKPAGKLASGQLDGTIRLDASTEPTAFEGDLDIKQLIPEQLPVFQQEPPLRNGLADVRFKGHGRGDSVAAIAGSLNGNLVIVVREGQLQNNAANVAGSDLFFSTFQMLNPLAEQEDRSELICGVLNFDIEDGIARAENGVALQTAKVNVLGSGVINLKTEAIDFRAKPKAREGLGINIAQLSDIVGIGGTIMNPRTTTNISGAVRTIGTVGAAVATGGLTLLAEGLYNRVFATDDPCAVALGKVSIEEIEAGSKAPAEKTEDEDNVLESTGGKVKGFFEGLFGD